ncbi:MAG: ATP-binding protein [Lentisphaerae bacterium]|jgi:predicted AAA+ superfamily ATPase|nr:ATP-binding protein [Lentisphaerota bacterium]
MKYMPRCVDRELLERLDMAGAVLITGPKACGKTETAMQVAKSHVRLDSDHQARLAMEVMPEQVLSGAKPRLLDEWQEFPEIWNLVRHDIDEKRAHGLYILAGSAHPEEKSRLHSGAGRFSVMQMRPMSLFERGWSTGEVSLQTLFKGGPVASEPVCTTIGELAEKVIIGGWPGLLRSTYSSSAKFSRDYATLIAEVDISRVSDKRRDPGKVFRLMQSVARNISTEVSIASLAADVRGGVGGFKEETAADYLSALERLMFVENLPAWSTHIRSSATLRQMVKRHFVDPSLACGVLGLNAEKLLKDLEYFGFVFESLAIRDLRIYAQQLGGEVRHYRDSSGLEVDAIVELGSGNYLAIEVKLSVAAADEAAANLLKFGATIDTGKAVAPSALVVITANGFAHCRKDGVYVVPLTVLAP